MSVLLFVGVVVAFLPALANGFVWDDINVIVQGEKLREWSGAAEAFRRPATWSADLPIGAFGTYRPLSLASFVLDRKVHGHAPWGFHLTSVLLHGAAALLVFRVLLVLAGSLAAAAVVTLATALHPSTLESVVWVNGRSDVLALLFGAAALLVALTGKDRLASTAGLASLLLLAMLSKETGAVFVPFALLAARRSKTTRAALIAAGAAVTSYAALRWFALGGSTVPGGGAWLAAAFGFPSLLARALQAALVPTEIAPVTVARWLAEIGLAERLSHFALLIALACVAAHAWKRQPLTTLGLTFFAATLLPGAFVVVHPWPGLNRWLYLGLPALGLAVFAGLPTRARTVAVGVIAPALMLALTQRGIPVWQNEGSLFARAIEESPNDPFGYQALGAAMVRIGRHDAAATLFEEAIKRGGEPSDTWAYWAFTSAKLGRCAQAAARYQKVQSTLVPPAAFRAALDECWKRAANARPAKLGEQ